LAVLGLPGGALTTLVARRTRLRTNTSLSPFTSGTGTKFVASDSYATTSPSEEAEGNRDAPLPVRPEFVAVTLIATLTFASRSAW